MSWPFRLRRPDATRLGLLALIAGLLVGSAIGVAGDGLGPASAPAVTGSASASHASTSVSSAAAPSPALRRIVAVGDIHGAFFSITTILREAGLIDRRNRWSGGDAVLVQTGDFLDRGNESLRVASWLKELQEEAARDGGEVIVLLGNHEVLNIIGDMRYVPPRIYAPLADAGSDVKRRALCSDRVKVLRRKARLRGQRLSPVEMMNQCLDMHPPGLVEYFETLGPDGELGAWLRSLPAVVRVDDIIFLHGGLSPALKGWSLDEINSAIRQEIADFDTARSWMLAEKEIFITSDLREIFAAARERLEGRRNGLPPELKKLPDIKNWLILRQDGPLWFRGYSKWTDEEGAAEVPALLESLNARYIVVGHTPGETKRIDSRFDDRIFLIDTGMLTSVYKGVPSALEFTRHTVRAIYPDAVVVNLLRPEPAEVASTE